MMKTIRTYVDTSIFGGVFDSEFDIASAKFFEQVKAGEFQLVTSAVVYEEIIPAPGMVGNFFEEMLPYAEVVDVTSEALALRDAYLNEKIVTPKYSDDALHVALATLSDCSIILSWNFKHIVHFDKIPLYNAVNTLKGYGPLNIFSPLEVIRYE